MRRACAVLAALVLVTIAAGSYAERPADAAGSGDVVVSQVYGGGGNSGAPFHNDFVEVFNRGATAVNLSGWVVRYNNSSGSFTATTALSGSIAPGRYYLVQEAAGAGGGAALPAPDTTGTISMSTTAATVAVLDGSASVHDLVGYGATAASEGSPVPALSNTTAALRNAGGCTDTDVNSADFSVTGPAPRNSASPAAPACTGGGGAPARIHDIQGATHVSPLNGQTVTGVPGVVTVVRTNGFALQDPNPDADPATSEGIFVFTSSPPTVGVGDAVTVAGAVSEFRPGGSGGAANLTSTEITGPTITVASSGNPLPPPTVIGSGGRVPPMSVIENDATANVETSGLFDPPTDGIDFYESLEDMLAIVNNPVAVGPTSAFGELPVLGDDGSGAGVRSIRGGIVVQPTDFNPERVILDDELLKTAGNAMPVAAVGDHLGPSVSGLIDYSFGNFKLQVATPPTLQPRGLGRQTAPAAAAGQMALATFNVENLSARDAQSKFDALAATVVTNLAAPDLLAIEEIQDDNGDTERYGAAADDGTVTASQTWNRLITAISAAGGPPYVFRQIDPVNDQDGGSPGGNIRQGFLFRTDRGLSFVDRPGATSTSDTAIVAGPGGPRLSASPGRLSPNDPSFGSSRKPLAGEFMFAGQHLIVVANHFNSKGGDDPLFGKDQPPIRSSETKRHQQAQIVHDAVAQAEAIDSNANIAVLGDLNDFEFSDTVGILTAGGALIDLPATLPVPERYTYVFDGNSQVLDHILLSGRLFAAPDRSYQVVHVNSDLPALAANGTCPAAACQVSDHEPQVVRLDPTVSGPPPTVPEAPSALLLPLSAVGMMVAALLFLRRRVSFVSA